MEMQNEMAPADKLNGILQRLKQTFIGKDDIIDLMGICLAGRENLFLLGPPGTAKSAMVRGVARYIDGKSFEYLLTRFTEPNELFGPFDIRRRMGPQGGVAPIAGGVSALLAIPGIGSLPNGAISHSPWFRDAVRSPVVR